MGLQGEVGSAPGLRAGLQLLPASHQLACHDTANAHAVIAEACGWPIRQESGGLGWGLVASTYRPWALGDIALPL